MKKTIFSLVLILLGALTINAQEKVVLHLHNGQTVEQNVADVDSITFHYVEVVAPYITNASIQSVGKTSAVFGVTLAGTVSELSSVGIMYSTDKSSLNLSSQQVTDIPESGNVRVSISGLSQETTYYALAYGVVNGKNIYGSDTIQFTTLSDYPKPEIVDLGLSVKWASWNVGATSPDEYGMYLGWGDPTGNNNSYKDEDYPLLSQTNNIAGSDNDIAFVKWGKGWQIPTYAQWNELRSKCTWTWSTRSGIYGWEVKASNGNSIFIPNGGYYTPKDRTYVRDNSDPFRTFYWSSEQIDQNDARAVNLNVEGISSLSDEKMLHLPIRAVYIDNSSSGESGEFDTQGEKVPLNKNVAGSSVDLGFSVLWADRNVGADNSTEIGDYYAWADTISKADYSTDSYGHFNETLSDITRSKNDAARMRWGGKWRMPTVTELYELIDGCTWTWDSSKGGYTATSNINGKSIFFPANGYMNGTGVTNAKKTGAYWSSENDNRADVNNKDAYSLQFLNDGNKPFYSAMPKELGYCIRPVMDK